MGACFMETSSLNMAHVRTLTGIVTPMSTEMLSCTNHVTSSLTCYTKSSCMGSVMFLFHHE